MDLCKFVLSDGHYQSCGRLPARTLLFSEFLGSVSVSLTLHLIAAMAAALPVAIAGHPILQDCPGAGDTGQELIVMLSVLVRMALNRP